jgi:predicted nuclease with TOPRIM domain
VSLRGSGVTIDLTFPEEAHPGDDIWHNATLTANSALTLYNLTLIVKAPINSTWEEATRWALSNRVIPENDSRTEEMNFQLPSNTNGTLQCFIYVNTNQSAHYLSTTFYTTRVSELTFSEMQSLYDEMLANYTALQEDYATLQNEYGILWANYTILFDNYTALVSDYGALSDQYDAQVAKYQKLSDDYGQLSKDKNDLDESYRNLESAYGSKISELSDWKAKYDELNATRYSLQGNYTNLYGNYTSLQTDYDELNQAYTALLAELTRSVNDLNSDKIVMFIFIVAVAALVAFIVYLKRKQQEPYLVIRKETVSVKPEEKKS